MESKMTYGGAWWTPETSEMLGGTLEIDNARGVFLLTYSYYSSETREVTLFPDTTKKMPIIWGNASNGAKITLQNCKVIGGSSKDFEVQTHKVSVEFVYIGAHLPAQSLSFQCYRFTFSNIIEFCNLCHFEDVSNSKTTIAWDSKEPVSIFVRDGLNITFASYISPTPLLSKEPELLLTQNISVRFSYNVPVNPKECLADVRCLLQLIQLGVEGTVVIEESECRSCQICFGSKFNSELKLYIAEPKIISVLPNRFDYLFYLDDLVNEDNLISAWYLKHNNLKLIVDLYSSFYLPYNMPIEMLFLNAVQALESYHARFITDKFEIYHERVETYIASDDEYNSKLHRSRLLALRKDGTLLDKIRLFDRLSDLFLFEFEEEFFTIDRKAHPYDFIQLIVDTRHYFTHHNPAKSNKILHGYDLHSATQILRVVIECYFLKEIGFNREFINGRIQEKSSMLYNNYYFYKNQDEY